MTKQTINRTRNNSNDGTGDNLRAGAGKDNRKILTNYIMY